MKAVLTFLIVAAIATVALALATPGGGHYAATSPVPQNLNGVESMDVSPDGSTVQVNYEGTEETAGLPTSETFVQDPATGKYIPAPIPGQPFDSRYLKFTAAMPGATFDFNFSIMEEIGMPDGTIAFASTGGSGALVAE